MVIDPVPSTGHIRFRFVRVEKWRTVFSQEYRFPFKNIVVNFADLSGSTIVRVGGTGACQSDLTFSAVYRDALTIKNIYHF